MNQPISGIDYFSGRSHPALARRVAHLQSLLSQILGDPPDIKELPIPPRYRPRFHRLIPTGTHRSGAIECALGVMEALSQRDLSGLAKWLHAQVMVLWCDGGLRKHSKTALLQALQKFSGPPMYLYPYDVFAYGPSELRAVLPRGTASAIDALIDGPNWMAVTMAVDEAESRVMVVTCMDPYERWRAQTLILPSGDEGAVLSVAPNYEDDESVRVADRLIRHLILGHSQQVRALRPYLLARIFLDQEIIPAEALADLAAAGPERLEQLDIVFLASERVALESVSEPVSRLMPYIKREAKSAWGRSFEQLHLRLVSCSMDYVTGAPEPPAVTCLLLGSDESPQARWRLGALFQLESVLKT